MESQESEGHLNIITHIVFSIDSRFLLSSSLDYSIKLWHIEEGREIYNMLGHSG